MRAFVPDPLPPARPSLVIDRSTAELDEAARAELSRLDAVASTEPTGAWLLHGFVRKEAVLTSQIEGTQATLREVLAFEATGLCERPDDVEEVRSYVDALTHARMRIADPKGPPLSVRLLCEGHRILMRGVRGRSKRPGEVRRSQNWIGGSRPGTARLVPPPPEDVPLALSALERWLHEESHLPPLVRAGLAHVQFETIHPFLDGNGRIGRLLIALLMGHWDLLGEPLLCPSAAFKRRQQEYYRRLGCVRMCGDWEGWTRFFLECILEAASSGVRSAEALRGIVARDRDRVISRVGPAAAAVELLGQLPTHPIVTAATAPGLLGLVESEALAAIELLANLGVLRETATELPVRVYAYREYLDALADNET